MFIFINFKKLLKFSVIFSFVLVSFIFCSGFLRSPNKTKSIGQVKKEIAESLIDILNQSSKTIELLAKSQIKVYDAIAQLVNSDKDSKLVKANKKDLENSLEKLSLVKENNDIYINKVVEFLKLANLNFVEKVENKDENKERNKDGKF